MSSTRDWSKEVAYLDRVEQVLAEHEQTAQQAREVLGHE